MDNPGQGDSIGEKWYATLRDNRASLTSTVYREPLRYPGGPAGEGAR
ncbi:DUF6380 family protein [Streptomyces brasiliscabiei]